MNLGVFQYILLNKVLDNIMDKSNPLYLHYKDYKFKYYKTELTTSKDIITNGEIYVSISYNNIQEYKEFRDKLDVKSKNNANRFRSAINKFDELVKESESLYENLRNELENIKKDLFNLVKEDKLEDLKRIIANNKNIPEENKRYILEYIEKIKNKLIITPNKLREGMLHGIYHINNETASNNALINFNFKVIELKKHFNKAKENKNHNILNNIINKLEQEDDEITIKDFLERCLAKDAIEILEKKYTFDYNERRRNVIYYGPPGTGKSTKIKNMEDEFSKIIRTTFHPEYSYYDFVGQYKPCTGYLRTNDIFLDNENKLYSITKDKGIRKESIRYRTHQRNDIDYKLMKKRYNTEMDLEQLDAIFKGDNTNNQTEKRISIYAKPLVYYDFIPGPFIRAVCNALRYEITQNNEVQKNTVLLVIEEINRGNTSAIFGDIFQLLDRKKGRSDYEITLPIEIKDFIKKELKWCEKDWNHYFEEGFYIPDNLYIYATMNTSVESIYPMDSAFKRRWQMEYIPIKYNDVEYNKMNLEEVYLEKPNDGIRWLDLIEIINDVIKEIKTEDKQIGQYFILPKSEKIDNKDIKYKLLEYLWFYVFKYGRSDIFNYKIKSFDKLIKVHDEGGLIKVFNEKLKNRLEERKNGESRFSNKISNESSEDNEK
ncbi:MAG: hypothetical protein FH751_07410 [Firmicutes bacterium]|nr:hypothetical protein [Bacillota bacterium]